MTLPISAVRHTCHDKTVRADDDGALRIAEFNDRTLQLGRLQS